MKIIPALTLYFIFACGLAQAAEDTPKQTEDTPRQTEKSYEPADGSQGYRYLLHLPEGAKAGKKKWPLLVFLHGRGERGDNLNRVKAHGPPKFAEKKDMEFIVVSPQCPKSDLWWKPNIVAGLVDEVIGKHHVDKDRVYLTGLSQGGFGTWATAAEYPKKFAAVAPVCGGGKVEWAKKYGKLPIWNFHDKDGAVPVIRSRIMVEAIKKAGGKVKYTEYPGVGHNSWNQAYDDPKLYEWFLSHKR
jgi:predicted peptidase